MKKICSMVLVVALMLSIFTLFGVQSAAADNVVDVSYAQSNINTFINFIKIAKGTIKNNGHYLFHEDDYTKGALNIKTDYCYYPADNSIQIKSILTYTPDNKTNEKRNIVFTIPGQYTGKATIHYDYLDQIAGKTMQAQADIAVTKYDGTNATFTKTGGNASDSQKQLNWWANYALITADNLAFKKGRTETAVYGMGFCGMCDSHTYEPHLVRANFSKNGEQNRMYCHWCGRLQKTGTTIARVQSVALSQTAVYYNGKVKTPTVTVKDEKGKTLKLNTDYTVSYAKGRVEIGKYAVKVTMKGKYSGSKTLYFTINPGKPQISKNSAGKKALALKWGKVNRVSGYQIQYATSSSFTSAKTVAAQGANTLNKQLGSLSSGRRYYVRVRSYKATTFDGEKLYIYSGWSTVKNAVVK